jgi:8-oxo-dGTP pyrophosphatase MutT (NUDIX family)
MRMTLEEQLWAYRPYNEQEAADRQLMLALLSEGGQRIYTRDNRTAHMTASAWVVDPTRTMALMVWHNIYQSWSWLGGHADGERDLLSVAMREVEEESGLTAIAPASENLFSLEILTVDGHEKNGKYVSSHLHLNVTYLIVGDPQEQLYEKPDENSGVRWFALEDAVSASTEPWFQQRIYRKLNEKLKLDKSVSD